MYLGNRSAADGLRVNMAEYFAQWLLQLAFDEGEDVGAGNRAHIALQMFELFRPFAAKDVHTGRQYLPEFDKSRP